MADVYENLKKLGLELPTPPEVGGVYVKVRQCGNILYTSGQGPAVNGQPQYKGKLGREITMEKGQEAARLVVLNILSVLHEYLGDLNKIKGVVKVLGFVASAEGFNSQPLVVNAASQLFVDVFGQAGQHARSAIGVNELPDDIPVEIEAIIEI